VLVGNNNGRARLLINNIGNRNHWVGLRLVGERTRRDMLGARVGIIQKDGSTRWRRVRADGSYASANDPRVLVGLGDRAEAPSVQVRRPSGRVEEWSEIVIDRYTTLREGSGRPSFAERSSRLQRGLVGAVAPVMRWISSMLLYRNPRRGLARAVAEASR
jgi:hypothetical protein